MICFLYPSRFIIYLLKCNILRLKVLRHVTSGHVLRCSNGQVAHSSVSGICWHIAVRLFKLGVEVGSLMNGQNFAYTVISIDVIMAMAVQVFVRVERYDRTAQMIRNVVRDDLTLNNGKLCHFSKLYTFFHRSTMLHFFPLNVLCPMGCFRCIIVLLPIVL